MEDEHLILLGRIDGKLDLLIEKQDKNDKRLTAVEKKIWYGQGALALASLAFLPKLKALLGF